MTSPTPSSQVENGIRPEALQGSGDRTSPYPWTPRPWSVGKTGHIVSPARITHVGFVSWAGEFINRRSEADANARLIAAAPDLFEALIDARSQLEAYEKESTGETYIDLEINAAIAKALPPNPASNKSRGTGQ